MSTQARVGHVHPTCPIGTHFDLHRQEPQVAVERVVVVAAGQSIDERAMIRSLKGEIATFKVPKCVHVVAELPRNAMGKVQKNVLRERFS